MIEEFYAQEVFDANPIHKAKYLLEAVYNRNLNELQTGAPVSYTHLRAHETVLDLVCRLLLEKKKKKKNKKDKKKTKNKVTKEGKATEYTATGAATQCRYR